MLTIEMLRTCIALLAPHFSTSQSLASTSSQLLTSSVMLSASSTSSASALEQSLGSSIFGVGVSVYKVVVLVALLSLIPSQSPTSSNLVAANLVKEADLQKMFKLRNENEWKSLWHQEKHVRCRDQLLSHMDWACNKDIYRLEKRFQMTPSRHRHHFTVTMNNLEKAKIPNPIRDFFIEKPMADTVIKPWSGYIRRKREEKSITDECCSAAGCTWEEYAEYCPAHRRLQSRSHANKRK